jgi:hypothetical protein
MYVSSRQTSDIVLGEFGGRRRRISCVCDKLPNALDQEIFIHCGGGIYSKGVVGVVSAALFFMPISFGELGQTNIGTRQAI